MSPSPRHAVFAMVFITRAVHTSHHCLRAANCRRTCVALMHTNPPLRPNLIYAAATTARILVYFSSQLSQFTYYMEGVKKLRLRHHIDYRVTADFHGHRRAMTAVQ